MKILQNLWTSQNIWTSENKVVQKLKCSKNDNRKKPSTKLIFFNEKKIVQKDSNYFWHRKLTLKVRFRHFFMTYMNICQSQIKELFFFYWKSQALWDSGPQKSTTEVTLLIWYLSKNDQTPRSIFQIRYFRYF